MVARGWACRSLRTVTCKYAKSLENAEKGPQPHAGDESIAPHQANV